MHREEEQPAVTNTHEILRLAKAVEPETFLSYLFYHGWTQYPSNRYDVAILRKQDVEIILPLDKNLGDYVEAILMAVNKAKLVEGNTSQNILSDLCKDHYIHISKIRQIIIQRLKEAQKEGYDTLSTKDEAAFTAGFHRGSESELLELAKEFGIKL